MTFPRALARYTRGAINNMILHLPPRCLRRPGARRPQVRHRAPGVRALGTGTSSLIGLNFGRQSDWYQNIKAAGTCRIRLGGEQLTLGAPALVPAEQAARDIPRLFRFALRHVVHTDDCVQLPVLQASRTPVTRR